MDNSTVKKSIRENRYYGDDLIGRHSEGDTVYSVISFLDINNPDVFSAQDRDTLSDIKNRFESFRKNHESDLLVLVVFDLEMDDPSADLPLSPTNVEILERLDEGET